MISVLSDYLNKNKLKEKLLNNNLEFKFSIASKIRDNPKKHKLFQTEDIFSSNKYIGKLVFTDEYTEVYIIVPYLIKEKNAKKLIKDELFLNKLFADIPNKIILKYLNEDMYTEYISMSLNEIFQNINRENLNKFKPIVFPQIYDLESLVPTINCPNGSYTLVNKK